ncbi:MAG: HAMP domain-containing sensor histidine kinase [Leptolyngbyaceae bacterium]|nr:HAMP domain-containing sensor histidine kinase [Leptolyngbyaceae bacterium]
MISSSLGISAQTGVPNPNPTHATRDATHDTIQLSPEFAALYPSLQQQLKKTATSLMATDIWLGVHSIHVQISQKKLEIRQKNPNPDTLLNILHYCGETDSYHWVSSDSFQKLHPYFHHPSTALRVIELSRGNENQSDDCGVLEDTTPTQGCYACAYGLTAPQVLVAKTEKPLSALQSHCLEQQTQLVKQQLDAAQHRSHLDHRVQLLEQTLHRIEHQLRNPLELICLYSDLLSHYLSTNASPASEQNSSMPPGSSLKDADLLGETVQRISKAARTIRSQLSQIKNCSQSSTLQIESCKLDGLVADVIGILNPLAHDKSVHIEIQGPPTDVHVDPWQFKEVLTNLISNAVHFSPADNTVLCRWSVFSDEIMIEICDKGSGFSPQDLKKSFIPFYSRRPGGTGLGLTIARKIVLDHRGSLWAENLPLGGARLCIVLPRKLTLGAPL